MTATAPGADGAMTATAPGAHGGTLADGLRTALAHHWHPVCSADDLPGPVGVRLLGRDLVVARLGAGGDPGDGVVALVDRCPHRSTRLSVGEVDGDCLRCAYHGWAYASDGRCVDIPSLPGGPIPGRAAVDAFDAVVEHGLVWVRLDASVPTRVPACPARADPEMKVLTGEPYTWPVAAPRRVENFVDLAHFAFVHDGSLGRRDEPVPPIPDVRRVDAELRFDYDPPAYPDERDDTAMLAASAYRMPMPCSVDIAFTYPDGRRRRLWMAASPVDDATCRTFWCIGRTDDLAGDDRDHLAFQARVLAEDEPVVCNQVPPEMLLDPGAELSVRTDKVSIEYRRWLRELATAALAGPAAYAAALGLDRPGPAVHGPITCANSTVR
jgi:phenylpropionate dioxygenase-like ring-hydroxylating dioxygenase large terminal subunit